MPEPPLPKPQFHVGERVLFLCHDATPIECTVTKVHPGSTRVPAYYTLDCGDGDDFILVSEKHLAPAAGGLNDESQVQQT